MRRICSSVPSFMVIKFSLENSLSATFSRAANVSGRWIVFSDEKLSELKLDVFPDLCYHSMCLISFEHTGRTERTMT